MREGELFCHSGRKQDDVVLRAKRERRQVAYIPRLQIFLATATDGGVEGGRVGPRCPAGGFQNTPSTVDTTRRDHRDMIQSSTATMCGKNLCNPFKARGGGRAG